MIETPQKLIEAAPSKSKKCRIFLVVAVAIAVLLPGAAYYLYTRLALRITQLEQQLSELSRTVDTLPRETSSIIPSPPAPLVAAPAEELEEESPSETASDALRPLLAAATHLQQAIQSGASFDTLLPEFAHYNDPLITMHINALTPYAAKGVKTPQQLRDEFTALNLKPQVTSYFNSLVKIRKVDSDDGTLAQAEKAVMVLDISGAVAALQTLQGKETRERTAAWLQNAQHMLLATEKAQAILQQVIANSAKSEDSE
jgi:hypothetical protein